MSNRSTTQGFSLVELFVYVALLSAIAVLVVASLLPLASSYRELRAARDVTHGARSALEHITREVQRSEAIVSATSTFDVHPGQLGLVRGPTTTVYVLNGGGVELFRNGVSLGTLTGRSAAVDSLVFRNQTTATSTVVRVEVALTSTRGEATRSAQFETSAVMRGVY